MVILVLILAGIVGILAGIALRAVATTKGWSAGAQTPGRRHLEAALIIFAVCFWLGGGLFLFRAFQNKLDVGLTEIGGNVNLGNSCGTDAGIGELVID